MATTTNYGWDTPDDTDLVKDGAAAIRTLGSSIDTTTKNLNPETTLGDIAYRSATANTNTRLPIGSNGQILGVSAGVPAWINNDQGDITEVQAGTGISVASGTGPIPVVTNTVATAFDAKGDLVVGTGADTFSKLTVGGTNGHTLQVDSSTSTGLKWAAPAAGGGFTLINSGGTTLSGNTTVSSIGGYTHLFFIIEGACASGGSGVEFFLRFNGDSSANYAWAAIGSFNNATANNCGFDKADTEWKIGFRYGNTTNFNDGNYVSGWVYRYGSSEDKVVNVDTWGTDGSPNTTPFFWHTRGAYNSSSAITSILVGADNSLTGGKIYVYGVN
jgi:hypothetical protein